MNINPHLSYFSNFDNKVRRVMTSILWEQKVPYSKCQKGFLLIKLNLNPVANLLSDFPYLRE